MAPKKKQRRSLSSSHTDDQSTSCSHCKKGPEDPNSCLDHNNCYLRHVTDKIKIMYIIAILAWIIFAIIFKLHTHGLAGFFLLLFPIIVYTINFANVDRCPVESEADLFSGDFLAFAFLTAIILINWAKVDNTTHIFKLLMISLVLIMISFIDLWLPRKRLILAKHFKSIVQTAAITLLTFVLFLYYKQYVLYIKHKQQSTTTSKDDSK